MYVKRHEYFRWTPRTARITITYVVLIPSIFMYMAFHYEVSHEASTLTEERKGALGFGAD